LQGIPIIGESIRERGGGGDQKRRKKKPFGGDKKFEREVLFNDVQFSNLQDLTDYKSGNQHLKKNQRKKGKKSRAPSALS